MVKLCSHRGKEECNEDSVCSRHVTENNKVVRAQTLELKQGELSGNGMQSFREGASLTLSGRDFAGGMDMMFSESEHFLRKRDWAQSDQIKGISSSSCYAFDLRCLRTSPCPV